MNAAGSIILLLDFNLLKFAMHSRFLGSPQHTAKRRN